MSYDATNALAWGIIIAGALFVIGGSTIDAIKRHRQYKRNVLKAVSWDATRDPQSHVQFVEKRDA